MTTMTFTDRDRVIYKMAYKAINIWKELWEPGKACALDFNDILEWIERLNPELFDGGIENMTDRQFRAIVQGAIVEAHGFPFAGCDDRNARAAAFKAALKRDFWNV